MPTESKAKLSHAIILALIPVLGTITVAIINNWRAKPPGDGIYRVRVTVLDPQKLTAEDAKVWSSAGGEPKKVQGGWQFDIPGTTKSKDGKVTIFASHEARSLIGQTTLFLGDDYNPQLEIYLKFDESVARVRGYVVDWNDHVITGAQVFVVGHSDSSVITGEDGNFELPAHAAVGQMVMLHAEKAGYRPVTQEHPVGNHPATLILEKGP